MIGVLVFPYVGVLVYMTFQGRGIAERNAARVHQVRDQLRSELGFSVADEIEKLHRLEKFGIDREKFGIDRRACIRRRTKLVA